MSNKIVMESAKQIGKGAVGASTIGSYHLLSVFRSADTEQQLNEFKMDGIKREEQIKEMQQQIKELQQQNKELQDRLQQKRWFW